MPAGTNRNILMKAATKWAQPFLRSSPYPVCRRFSMSHRTRNFNMAYELDGQSMGRIPAPAINVGLGWGFPSCLSVWRFLTGIRLRSGRKTNLDAKAAASPHSNTCTLFP
ncbi:hypothetical protein O181_029484 [Austropuccinia psidii MF-1]|uniref:Uncharacterized protein n=1 Tax=Austropuccinia psidii MF-1 TaxID=1389203 RepID=A0A9Q3CSE2_9BASI|nr:hypothetical protein [Austropuccinia psidii MF-1]